MQRFGLWGHPNERSANEKTDMGRDMAQDQEGSAVSVAILPVSWRKLILSISLLLMVTLLLRQYLAGTSDAFGAFLFGFDLQDEMNFAVWWMSALLLLCSLSFYEFYSRGTAGHRTPWLLLSLIFLLFSWDELGSLHERYFGFRSGYGIGTVVLLIVAAAAAGAALYAVPRLIVQRQTRTSGWLLFLAFALYATVPFQEVAGNRLDWPSWAIGLRRALEEGTELAATLLAVSAVAVQRPWARGSLRQILPDTRAFVAVRPVLLALLVLHCIVSLLYIPTIGNLSVHGNPGSWYPVAVYFLLACHALSRTLEWRPGRTGLRALALYLLVCSLLLAIRLDRWWPTMTVTSPLLTSFYVAYAYHLALFGAFIAGLGRLGRRTLPLYLATAVLPLIVLPSGNPALTAFVLGVSAYLYAEILYLMDAPTEAFGMVRERVGHPNSTGRGTTVT
jgi:hypothetical protein